MRVTEQVDALETLAITPTPTWSPRASRRHPDVPGGHRRGDGRRRALRVVHRGQPARSLSVEFLRGARQFYNFKDVWFGLVKSASFGGVVATMGCFEGLNARGGAEGVGQRHDPGRGARVPGDSGAGCVLGPR